MTETVGRVAGYRVTVDSDMGDGASGCWIESDKGRTASLECADATGVLSDDYRDEGISRASLSSIRKWAEARGY